jgi:hypothetical protein
LIDGYLRSLEIAESLYWQARWVARRRITPKYDRHGDLFKLWCVLRGVFKHATGKKIIMASPCGGIQLEAIIGSGKM